MSDLRIGWDDLPGGGPGAGDLAEEAIFLARLLVSLLPAVLGLVFLRRYYRDFRI